MVKNIVLVLLLFICSIYDLKERRIPNDILGVGILFGFLSSGSLIEILWKIVALLFLFFFGMLRIMGMGDLKLWMFLSTYVGFMDSFVIMVAAAILLILYGWLKNKKETTLIFRHLLISFKTKRKPQVIEQTSYAFAPFILTATLFYLLKGVVL